MSDKTELLGNLYYAQSNYDMGLTSRNAINEACDVIEAQQARIKELESESAMQLIIDQLEGQLSAMQRRSYFLNEALNDLIGDEGQNIIERITSTSESSYSCPYCLTDDHSDHRYDCRIKKYRQLIENN